MSIIYGAPIAAQRTTEQSRTRGLVAILKRRWEAYLTWRIEQAAIAQLLSMSDRELKDIGLTRSQIPGAVIGEPGARPFNRYY